MQVLVLLQGLILIQLKTRSYFLKILLIYNEQHGYNHEKN